MVQTHTLRGKRYRVELVRKLGPNDGECDKPTKPGKAIRIVSSLKGERGMEVVIHEALHACAWDWDEEAVTETAHDITRLLWRLGYRRVEVEQ